MTTVITVPPSLDDQTFEQVVDQLRGVAVDAKLLVDARHTRWSSPYGLTALLTLGQTRAERATLAVPETEETASYWARANFFKHAEEIFELSGSVPRPRGGESGQLLEITSVTNSEDVHTVVGRIQQKSQQILTNELHIDARATVGFAMTLSEICQNIVEHAGRGGFVAVQTYNYKTKAPNRRAAVIAVCDAGCGFRESLESLPGRVRAERWDDAAALEEAVIQGVSRFRDPGRGQGLAGVRKYIGRWDGKLSVRSGTARIAILPEWAKGDDVPLTQKLAPFPGAQVQVTIPRAGLRGPALMNHIDVSSVLRRTVSCELFSNLVTRPTGAAVRKQIESLVADSHERSLTVIDFSHVGMIDFSCADEVVAKLLLRYNAAEQEDQEAYFVFRGVNDDHWDAIETVLERHRLALVLEGDDGCHVVGKVDDADRLVWEKVLEVGRATPAELATVLGSAAEIIQAVCASLNRRGLLMRVNDAYVAVGGMGDHG